MPVPRRGVRGALIAGRGGRGALLPGTTSERALAVEMLRYLPAQVVPALCGFALVSALAHLLTPRGYGTYTLGVLSVAVTAALADGWLTNAVLRFYPEAEAAGHAARLYRRAWLYLALALVALLPLAGGAAVLVRGSIPAQLTSNLPILLPMAAAAACLDVAQALLRAQGRASAYATSSSLAALARLAACSGLGATLPDHLRGVLLGWLVAAGGTALASAVAAARGALAGGPTGSTLPPSGLSQLAFGGPVAAALLFSLALSDADRILLQALASTSAVGIYSAIYLITNGSLGVIYPLAISAAYPMAARLWHQPGGRERASDVAQEGLRYFLLLGPPAAVGLVVLGRRVLEVLTTGAYAKQWVIIAPVAAGVFSLGLGQYATLGLLLEKRGRLLTLILSGSALLNVALNIALIPPLGLLGSALATLVAYSVFAVVAWAFVRTTLRPRLVAGTVWRVAAGCVAMAGALSLAQRWLPATALGLVGCVALGSSVYAGSLSALGQLSLTRTALRLRPPR